MTQMRRLQLQNHLSELEYAGANLNAFSISKTSHNVTIWSRIELIAIVAINGSPLERDRLMLYVFGRFIDVDATNGLLFRRS